MQFAQLVAFHLAVRAGGARRAFSFLPPVRAPLHSSHHSRSVVVSPTPPCTPYLRFAAARANAKRGVVAFLAFTQESKLDLDIIWRQSPKGQKVKKEAKKKFLFSKKRVLFEVWGGPPYTSPHRWSSSALARAPSPRIHHGSDQTPGVVRGLCVANGWRTRTVPRTRHLFPIPVPAPFRRPRPRRARIRGVPRADMERETTMHTTLVVATEVTKVTTTKPTTSARTNAAYR